MAKSLDHILEWYHQSQSGEGRYIYGKSEAEQQIYEILRPPSTIFLLIEELEDGSKRWEGDSNLLDRVVKMLRLWIEITGARER